MLAIGMSVFIYFIHLFILYVQKKYVTCFLWQKPTYILYYLFTIYTLFSFVSR